MEGMQRDPSEVIPYDGFPNSIYGGDDTLFFPTSSSHRPSTSYAVGIQPSVASLEATMAGLRLSSSPAYNSFCPVPGIATPRRVQQFNCNCSCCTQQQRFGNHRAIDAIRTSSLTTVPRTPINFGAHRLTINPNTPAEMRESIVRLARKPEVCEFLQRVVARGYPGEVTAILGEVVSDPWTLMCDSRAKYLFQSLLERCSEAQRAGLVAAIVRNPRRLLATCFNNHGTRSVQKLVESCRGSDNQRAALVRALCWNTFDLATNSNGKHVIKWCFRHLPRNELGFMLNQITYRIAEVAKDQYGCCVVQDCLHSDNQYHAGTHQLETQAEKNLIIAVIQNARDLSDSPYGNYVVQLLLNKKGQDVVVSIHKQLQGNYVWLSFQKHSSHVVEKCIEKTQGKERAEIIWELIQSPNAMEDPFGNYVYSKALSKAEGGVLRALLRLVREHEKTQIVNPHTRNIVQQARSFPMYFEDVTCHRMAPHRN